MDNLLSCSDDVLGGAAVRAPRAGVYDNTSRPVVLLWYGSVYGVEACRGVRIRGEAGWSACCAERQLGCIARVSAVERRIRSEYEAAGEQGHPMHGQLFEAMDGSTVLQESVGALKRGRRSGPASDFQLLAVEVAKDMGPLPRIELE